MQNEGEKYFPITDSNGEPRVKGGLARNRSAKSIEFWRFQIEGSAQAVSRFYKIIK